MCRAISAFVVSIYYGNPTLMSLTSSSATKSDTMVNVKSILKKKTLLKLMLNPGSFYYNTARF